MRANRLVVPAAAIGSVFLFSVALAADAGGTATGVTISPIGIGVHADAPGLDDLRMMNHNGVELELLVQSDAGGLIELDDDASKVTIEAGKQKLDTRLGMMPKFSPDGRLGIVSVTAAAPPAGLHELHATGTLVLRGATQTQTEKATSVKFEKGEKFNIGNTAWTIKSVDKPRWGDAALEIELEANIDPVTIKQVRFLDAAGKEIESSPSSSSTMRLGNNVQVSKNFTLKQKVDAATIEFVLWKDLKSIEVPLDVTATAGWTVKSGTSAGKPHAQR